MSRSLAEWLGRQEKSHPKAIDLTLDRVREVARRLGLLQPRYRVITVGGTNGKGSTVAYLDSILRAAGKRCGRFTSPHLTRYNERICVDGVEATDEQLIASFERIDAARGDITLTFFEYNALAALDCFGAADVEVAVLEVGLGGRLDATNILDADVAVVCSIGFDHMDWLGSSLDAIAREKAGIFRRGRPAVIGSAQMPAGMWRALEESGAEGLIAERDFIVSDQAEGWGFSCGAVTFDSLPEPAIIGAHQRANAATALAALTAAGLATELTREIVARALRNVEIRGRFQIVRRDPEWVLDVAHNVPAAEALAVNLRALPPARRTLAVCGILGDKDIPGIVAALAGCIGDWILVELDGPRAVSTEKLAASLPASAQVIARAPSVAQGCRAASEAARPGDRIVVFGSFLTVGPALDFLRL